MSFLGNADHAHALQDLIAAHHDGGYIIHVGDIQQFDEKHTRVISHIGDDPADHDMVFWEKDIPSDSIVVATQPTYRDDFPTTYVGTHDQTESAIAACMSIKDIKEGRRWLIRQATNTYNSLEQRADYARTIISTDNILKLRTPKKITALAQPVGQCSTQCLPHRSHWWITPQTTKFHLQRRYCHHHIIRVQSLAFFGEEGMIVASH